MWLNAEPRSPYSMVCRALCGFPRPPIPWQDGRIPDLSRRWSMPQICEPVNCGNQFAQSSFGDPAKNHFSGRESLGDLIVVASRGHPGSPASLLAA
jgi:hypothetical protein